MSICGLRVEDELKIVIESQTRERMELQGQAIGYMEKEYNEGKGMQGGSKTIEEN